MKRLNEILALAIAPVGFAVWLGAAVFLGTLAGSFAFGVAAFFAMGVGWALATGFLGGRREAQRHASAALAKGPASRRRRNHDTGNVFQERHYVIRAPVEGILGFYGGGLELHRSSWTGDLREASTYTLSQAQKVVSLLSDGCEMVPVHSVDYGVVHRSSGRWLVARPPAGWCGCLGVPYSVRCALHLVSGRRRRDIVGARRGRRASWSWPDAREIAWRARVNSGGDWIVMVARW